MAVDTHLTPQAINSMFDEFATPEASSSSKRRFLQMLAVLGGTSVSFGEGAAQRVPSSTPPRPQEAMETAVDPLTMADRIAQVHAERQSGFTSLVTELTTHESTINEDYNETVTLYDEEFAPFLFTKGMPLATDETGEPYPEGIVPYRRKRANYWNPILQQANINDSFKPGGPRLFIGAPNVHSATHMGMDSWRGTMPSAPTPTGVRNAAEMVDAYAMEQLRDVPFGAYPNGAGNAKPCSCEQDAFDALAADIETIERKLGESWWHSPDRPFVEADSLTVDWGPYLSQFLLHDVHMWALPMEQQYVSYEAGVDYNDTWSEWIATLEGKDEIAPETNPKLPESDERSYISTGRDLATIVNSEPPFQQYLIVALYLLERPEERLTDLPFAARDDGNVHSYTDSGHVGILDLVTRGARQALLAAFYQKYFVHFRCRPETYAGRVHSQCHDGRDFGIHSLLFESETLRNRDGETMFLSMAYEEGSPVHPAYPSGHSVIAGTCGTILKVLASDSAWQDDFYIPSPDGSFRETVRVPVGHRGIYQEIDKLISNVGLARMFAGVHYYSDHYHGVKLGEQVAVGLLVDFFERSYTEDETFTPTFSPYLEYDTEYDVSVDTLETLRSNAVSR